MSDERTVDEWESGWWRAREEAVLRVPTRRDYLVYER